MTNEKQITSMLDIIKQLQETAESIDLLEYNESSEGTAFTLKGFKRKQCTIITKTPTVKDINEIDPGFYKPTPSFPNTPCIKIGDQHYHDSIGDPICHEPDVSKLTKEWKDISKDVIKTNLSESSNFKPELYNTLDNYHTIDPFIDPFTYSPTTTTVSNVTKYKKSKK